MNQVLDSRYIERSQLLRLLRQLFGSDFLVEDRPDYYALTVPRRLTEVRSQQSQETLSHPCQAEVQSVTTES